MKELFTRKNVMTIPNLLTLIRLIMLPFIVIAYVGWQNYILAMVLIIISWVSDAADGFIARHFNQVSDLGKIVDPIADKLTEGVMLICLMFRYRLMVYLVIIFAFSELLKLAEGAIIMKRGGGINSARWYGKVFTFMLYVMCIILIAATDIDPTAANIMIIVCMGACVFTITMYTIFYIKLLKHKK